MIFNKHFHLEGRHAFLSPSQYHWIRYDEEKLRDRFITNEAAKLGTRLHQLASDLIGLGVKLPTRPATTLSLFVNDVLGFKMKSEQMLHFSDNCFGTADAIGFRRLRGDDKYTLRIFDLKTGETKASFDQLLVYAALFCLEYNFKPFDLMYDLRIYQSDEILLYEVNPEDVAHIMDKIKTFDRLIDDMKMEEVA